MASKKTDKTKAAPVKTYNSMRGFLVAKAAGALPRGVKAHALVNTIEFRAGGAVLLSVDGDDFVADSVKRLGFVLAK